MLENMKNMLLAALMVTVVPAPVQVNAGGSLVKPFLYLGTSFLGLVGFSAGKFALDLVRSSQKIIDDGGSSVVKVAFTKNRLTAINPAMTPANQLRAGLVTGALTIGAAAGFVLREAYKLFRLAYAQK